MEVVKFLAGLSILLLVSIPVVFAKNSLTSGLFVFSLSTKTSPPSISCTTCTEGKCSCSVSQCESGTLDFFYTSNCSSLPYREKFFSYGNLVTFPLNASTYVKILCDDSTVSLCTAINYYTTTTKTFSCQSSGQFCSSLFPCCTDFVCQNNACVSSNPNKSQCPYQCCSDDQNYLDKFCGSGTACFNHLCENILTPTTTTTAAPKIKLSAFAATFIALALLLILAYYVLGYFIGRGSARAISWKVKKERTVPKK